MTPDAITLADKINFAILISTVLAILVGPTIAVYLTRRIDLRSEIRRRRLEVYRNLMLTRTTRLAPDHVRALNLVPVDFAKVSAVIDPFKKYIDHLGSPLPSVDQQEQYFAQRSDIFYELLFQIGKSLGYNFDKRDLERLSYVPKGYVDEYNREQRTKDLLTQILEGTRTLPVSIGQPTGPTNPYPPPPERHRNAGHLWTTAQNIGVHRVSLYRSNTLSSQWLELPGPGSWVGLELQSC